MDGLLMNDHADLARAPALVRTIAHVHPDLMIFVTLLLITSRPGN